MPILSSRLPFSLSDSVTPSANAFYFKLDDSDDSIAVITSNTLPFALITVSKPLSQQLQFALGSDDPPIDPIEPLQPRRMTGAMGCYSTTNTIAINIGDDEQITNNSQVVAGRYESTNDDLILVAGCHKTNTQNFKLLSNCESVSNDDVVLLRHCHTSTISAFIALSSCFNATSTDVINYRQCATVYSSSVVHLRDCETAIVQSVVSFKTCISYQKTGYIISSQHATTVQRAVPVPCRYYPIPAPPPELPKFSCRIRPPSSQLPFNLTRRHGQIPSSNLPLPLMCWHDEPPQFIPNLRTYIMHHTITATIGDIDVNPLNFGIKSDMDGAYWQCSIALSDDDYERTKHLVNVDVGLEPMVNVIVNGDRFAFIGETPVRSRAFANNSHSLEGRSVTAKLGADYAVPNDGLFDLESYASQLMREQLQGLPYTIDEIDIEDWLIPARTYSFANKTTMAVIAEIADAAGGYIESHEYEPILSIRKRWPKSAWEIAAATPDVTIPADLIITDSTRTNNNPRYNTVFLSGNTFLDCVFREVQARDAEAPMQNHALYTDQNVTIAKGKAILSDSGTHAIYPLKLPWSNDVLALAKKGQIWQVNDTDGTWKGLVIGVDAKVGVVNDAPEPYQTVTIDRYLDN